MFTVVCFVIAGVALYSCVYKVCDTALKVAMLNHPVADDKALATLQQELDKQYEQEAQLTVDNVIKALNEVYGDEDREEETRAEA